MTDYIDTVHDRQMARAGDEYEDAFHPDQPWIDAQLAEIERLSERHGCIFRGIADRDDGSSALLFVHRNETYENYFTTGYCQSLEQAIEFSRDVFTSYSTEDIMVNIYKSDRLFPNIRGVMLKEKRVTLTMNGKVKIVEMREGNDARVEIFFDDHTKSAVINRTQAMIVADVYGPETTGWEGKPLSIYGENGVWFGKETWGLRVDKKETERQWKQAQRAVKQAEQAAGSNGNSEEEE